MAKKDKNTFISITNQDIYDEIQEMHKVSRETLAQATYTNGRVTNLENKSIGIWVSNNPIKLTLFILGFTGLFVSDFREPLFSILKTLM